MTENQEPNPSSDSPLHPNFYATHYRSGEEIHAGDRVCWAGKPGRVVFVLGSSNSPQDYADSVGWFKMEYGAGFMLDTEIAGLVFVRESDEDLELSGREN